MTRMTRPDCAVMCNLINTHTHTHTHTLRYRPLLKAKRSYEEDEKERRLKKKQQGMQRPGNRDPRACPAEDALDVARQWYLPVS